MSLCIPDDIGSPERFIHPFGSFRHDLEWQVATIRSSLAVRAPFKHFTRMAAALGRYVLMKFTLAPKVSVGLKFGRC